MPTLSQVEDAARRVTNLRINRGVLSVGLLARQTQKSKAFISQWRHGQRNAGPDTIDRLLKALRIELFTQARGEE